MAIDIEWQVKPPRKDGGNTTSKMFPRIVNSEVVDENKLANLMSKDGHFSRGNAKNVLTTFGETIARLLAEGKTVNLPYLGSFKLSIGADDTARSVKVKGVNFQPAKELMEIISTPNFHIVARNAAPVVPSASSLVAPLTEYFKSHDSITRTEFASLFKLKRTTACTRLKELQDMEVIKSVGSNRDTRYVKG